MLITKLHTPEGVKDYLPFECEFKTEIENKIINSFKGCGFKPISAPTMEYAEVFDNAGGIDSKRMYKFVDRDGTLLALRPDVTPSIARIFATADYNMPKKLYYVEKAFRRNESYQGKLREFTQAGIEIVDSKDLLSADIEAITMSVMALKSVGIDNFKIDIGHAKFLSGIIDEADVSDEIEAQIKESILNKNYVAVSEIANNIKNENIKSFLKDLPLLIGDYTILEKAKNRINNKVSLEALDYLSKVYAVLKSIDMDKYISFDLSVIGSMDYYTGIIFRGYAKGTGSSVIDGGRYDNMVSSFGKNMPAVGFAIKINDLIDIANINSDKNMCIYVAYNKGHMKQAFELVNNLRNDNIIVELSDLGNDNEENLSYAKLQGVDLYCYVNDSIIIEKLSDNKNTDRIIDKYNLK